MWYSYEKKSENLLSTTLVLKSKINSEINGDLNLFLCGFVLFTHFSQPEILDAMALWS